MTNDQPINYPYLAGHLRGAMHSLYNKLVAEGIVDNALSNKLRALQIIQEMLEESDKAERKYSTGRWSSKELYRCHRSAIELKGCLEHRGV